MCHRLHSHFLLWFLHRGLRDFPFLGGTVSGHACRNCNDVQYGTAQISVDVYCAGSLWNRSRGASLHESGLRGQFGGCHAFFVIKNVRQTVSRCEWHKGGSGASLVSVLSLQEPTHVDSRFSDLVAPLCVISMLRCSASSEACSA